MSTVLLDRNSFAERQGGVWEYISPSRMSCWLGCPLKFKLRYLDGYRAPTTPALFLGKVVHHGLEMFYRHRQLGVTLDADDLVRRIVESWGQTVNQEQLKFEDTAQEQSLQRQAIDLVTVYVRQMPAEPPPLAVEVAVEAPLVDPATGEDLRIPLVGIIDLVLEDAAGPLIVDFKTSSRSNEPLEIAHEIQLSSYAWIFREMHDHLEGGLESGVGRGISPRPQPQTGRASFQASGFPDDSILFFPSRFCGRGNADTRSGCCPSRPPSQGWQSG